MQVLGGADGDSGGAVATGDCNIGLCSNEPNTTNGNAIIIFPRVFFTFTSPTVVDRVNGAD